HRFPQDLQDPMASQKDDELGAMATEVRSLLRADQGRKWSSKALILLLILALLAGFAWWLWPRSTDIQWQTQVLDRADMVLSATATGNLQPKSEVTVGAEISGLVREVLVRENDQVRKGDVLARFDTQELRVTLEQ